MRGSLEGALVHHSVEEVHHTEGDNAVRLANQKLMTSKRKPKESEGYIGVRAVKVQDGLNDQRAAETSDKARNLDEIYDVVGS